MPLGITREAAWDLLRSHLLDERLLKHSLATEAVLRRLAMRLGEDPDYWGTVGLLHDLDLSIVGADPQAHAHKTVEILRAMGVDEAALEAILRHNDALGLPRRTTLDHALAAGETITGLIVATALVLPDKNLASVKPQSVVKRMKERAFAAGASREAIRECEQIGIPLPEFAELAVEAMRGIAGDLGLDGRLAQ